MTILSRTVLVMSASVLVFFACYGTPIPSNDTAAVIDVNHPDSWERGVERGKDNLRRIATALIGIARDRRQSDDERRKAIMTLGSIGNKEALDFLVAHIRLRYEVWFRINAEGTEEYPCSFALTIAAQQPEHGGNVVMAILRALDQPKSEEELLDLGHVLRHALTEEGAAGLVAGELKRANRTNNPDEVRIHNLSAIQKYLER